MFFLIFLKTLNFLPIKFNFFYETFRNHQFIALITKFHEVTAPFSRCLNRLNSLNQLFIRCISMPSKLMQAVVAALPA
jgi:hypothetical protein